MQRRDFLVSSLSAAAGAMTAAALPALPARALGRDTLDLTFRSGPLRFTPFPGTVFDAVAYNGRLPGPVIRIAQGQRLRCRYVNGGSDASTIHWHGMILPNAMDGVEDLTQPAVPRGGEFTYDFIANPAGTRWYHDHLGLPQMRGAFGMIVVEDPRDERADQDIALVFHDVPNLGTVRPAMMGHSNAPMVDPLGSPELLGMSMDDQMGDEVAYRAHCINGASYPKSKPIVVKVGQKIRLRILNANPTQTRYVRLAGHTLRVTHGDGNPLGRPVEVEALRVGVGERYDAWFEVRKPGAWLLQGISAEPNAFQQAVVFHTEGLEKAPPASVSQSLEGVKLFSYALAGAAAGPFVRPPADVAMDFELGGGKFGSDTWTINRAIWPNTPKILVNRGDRVLLHFKNKTAMDHPLHLHGHTFNIAEIDGKHLRQAVAKDTTLVRANGGTITWTFKADSPAGRWLLHCHNNIHMMDGMMTELVYRR